LIDKAKNDANDVPDGNVVCGDFSQTHASDLMKKYLIEGKLKNIDGIVYGNDEMAIGIIMTLKESGIAVPEQIAVVGADNIPAGRSLTPSLTTFDYLPFEQGRALRLLLDTINSKPAAVNLQTKM
jgi:DNA-binding LacI/PurR family transcriptional regulator